MQRKGYLSFPRQIPKKGMNIHSCFARLIYNRHLGSLM